MEMAATVSSEGGVLREGWLKKQNPSGLGFLKAGKERYFKLTGTALVYSKSERDAAVQEVPLTCIKHVEKLGGQGRQGCFEVATNLLQGDGKPRAYVLQVMLCCAWVRVHRGTARYALTLITNVRTAIPRLHAGCFRHRG